MPDGINVDFDKISKQIQNDIERANQNYLRTHPNASIADINYTAKIAYGVSISAIRAYHQELCRALKHTTD